MRVLSFGEILFDIIEGEHYLGGAPLNFAAHLAQLGAESYICSAVGADSLGSLALEKVKETGVQTSLIQVREDYPTGTVPVSIQNGQPDYTIVENVAYDFVDYPGEEYPLANQVFTQTEFDVLYFGSLIQRNSQSRDTLYKMLNEKKFKHVFYDVNLRKACYSEPVIRESLKHCSILKLNDEEVNVLSAMLFQVQESLTPEAFAKRLSQEFEIEVIVITAGGQGCYIYEKGLFQFVQGYPAQVVDTVGAGDAFSAAFVYHYLNRHQALQAADMGNKLGAFVASSRGPLPLYSAAIKKALGLMG